MRSVAPLVLVAAALAACSSNSPAGNGSMDAGVDGTGACPSATFSCEDPSSPLSYKGSVAPILLARCSPCHFPGGISDRIYDLSTFTSVANATTPILGQLAMCSMPPIHGIPTYGIEAGTVAPMPDMDREAIIQWIECGTHP